MPCAACTCASKASGPNNQAYLETAITRHHRGTIFTCHLGTAGMPCAGCTCATQVSGPNNQAFLKTAITRHRRGTTCTCLFQVALVLPRLQGPTTKHTWKQQSKDTTEAQPSHPLCRLHLCHQRLGSPKTSVLGNSNNKAPSRQNLLALCRLHLCCLHLCCTGCWPTNKLTWKQHSHNTF